MFVLLNLNLNSYALAEYTNEDLMKMNLQSLRADFTKDRAYSAGAGRITDNMPNSLSLARRAALSDARRGLLILRRELKEGRPGRPDDISGIVPPVKIISETESGDIYIVEVEAVLSELMRGDEFFRKEDEDNDEGYEDDDKDDKDYHDFSSPDYDDFI